MRIAICAADEREREQLCKWIGQYCELYGISQETSEFYNPGDFFICHEQQHFDIAFFGLISPEGFLQARRLREMDKLCKIVYIDDTAALAVKSVRLHFTDYIVRPVEFKKIVRAMKLAGAE